MASIFTKIIQGEIPGHFISQNDKFVALLDAFPLVKGHVLIVPKEEIDYIFDLSDEMLAEMHVFAKQVAKAMKKVIPCKRIGTAVIGLEVPHAHLHLVPMNSMDDINFSNPKIKVEEVEMKEICEAIKKEVNK